MTPVSEAELIEQAESFVEAMKGGGCPFCGHEPYEYVDVGVGGRGIPVAVTCCDHGIGLYQHGDEGLSRASGKISEATYIIERLLALRPKEAGQAVCSTCGGTREIDERLGGEPHSGIVPCPDCSPPPAVTVGVKGREPGKVTGHPSIAPPLDAGVWPSWSEIDAVATAYENDPQMAKIVRAAHAGMMRGPQGLRVLYDIRHAMGWDDLTGLSMMASGIAEMRKSYLWGDIQWAPRDGTHVLVKFEGTSSPPTVAHWFNDPDEPGWFLSVQQNAGPTIHPTHWQRLPAERNPELRS